MTNALRQDRSLQASVRWRFWPVYFVLVPQALPKVEASGCLSGHRYAQTSWPRVRAYDYGPDSTAYHFLRPASDRSLSNKRPEHCLFGKLYLHLNSQGGPDHEKHAHHLRSGSVMPDAD